MDKYQKRQYIRLLRQTIEPAFFLFLLIRMGRLPSKIKLARMLGMERRKVGRLLNRLIDQGFVRTIPGEWGYTLSDSISPVHEKIIEFYSTHQRNRFEWFEE